MHDCQLCRKYGNIVCLGEELTTTVGSGKIRGAWDVHLAQKEFGVSNPHMIIELSTKV